MKRPSPPLSAQYSRAMRQHGLFALLAIGGAFSFQTSSNQIMRLLSVMARQRTNEGLRLRRTITKPELEKPMIWRIVPGILTPVHLSADLREPRVPLRILRRCCRHRGRSSFYVRGAGQKPWNHLPYQRTEYFTGIVLHTVFIRHQFDFLFHPLSFVPVVGMLQKGLIHKNCIPL